MPAENLQTGYDFLHKCGIMSKIGSELPFSNN
jgi:hypothetical protein